MQKIVVFGGTGYIGSSLCEALLKSGYEVISISQSGKNKYLSDTAGKHICFIRANVLSDTHWQENLNGCIAVVNSIGILFQNKKSGKTYKRLITDVSEKIAQVAVDKSVPKFIHISAIKPPFLMLQSYHHHKQLAEEYLSKQSFSLQIIRPHIVVSPQKPLLLLLYKMQELLHFPFKYFESIDSINQQVLRFLKKTP